MKANLKFASSSVAALGLLALVGAMPANAADVIGEEPPAPAAPMETPPLNTWSGPYAGVSVGYGFAGRTSTPTTNFKTEGFQGGGFAGYNWQSGPVVFGGEADINYSSIRGGALGTSSRSGVDGSIRARLGYAITDDVLVYGTAGGAAQNLRVSDAAGANSKGMYGWTAGAGVDVKLTQQVFGRVEYRYSDYGRKTFDTGSGPQSVSSRDNRVTFGIGMKF